MVGGQVNEKLSLSHNNGLFTFVLCLPFPLVKLKTSVNLKIRQMKYLVITIGIFIVLKYILRFGRKTILLIAGFTDGLSFLLSGLMPTYTSFIICKVIQGFVSLGFATSAYVLGRLAR